MSTAIVERDDAAAESVRQTNETTTKQPRKIAIKVSTVLTALIITGLAAATCVFAGLYWSTASDLSDRDARAADTKHAQQLATDYAIGASTIDYRDAKAWFDKLKINTTPQLAAKFDATTAQLQQVLLPLQWTSKATPITSVVTAEANGIYKVNAFLDVNSTSAQTPAGVQTTVTYTVTIDKNAGWKITDVGGLDGALRAK
ncbi:hypothetical protein OG203_16205 [Nocardia sp. NBC_01499]|uniref:hypothetical protein n=1 Tax=Nocardia sp. NBC_01499 TaxID=2903597 RepID=UPI003863F1D6